LPNRQNRLNRDVALTSAKVILASIDTHTPSRTCFTLTPVYTLKKLRKPLSLGLAGPQRQKEENFQALGTISDLVGYSSLLVFQRRVRSDSTRAADMPRKLRGFQ
jgi:hypothetical protein